MSANPEGVALAALAALLAHSEANERHANAVNRCAWLVMERASDDELAAAVAVLQAAYEARNTTWVAYEKAAHDFHRYAVKPPARVSPRYAPPAEDE